MFDLRSKKSYEIEIEKLDSGVISHHHNAQVFRVVAKALLCGCKDIMGCWYVVDCYNPIQKCLSPMLSNILSAGKLLPNYIKYKKDMTIIIVSNAIHYITPFRQNNQNPCWLLRFT